MNRQKRFSKMICFRKDVRKKMSVCAVIDYLDMMLAWHLLRWHPVRLVVFTDTVLAESTTTQINVSV